MSTGPVGTDVKAEPVFRDRGPPSAVGRIDLAAEILRRGSLRKLRRCTDVNPEQHHQDKRDQYAERAGAENHGMLLSSENTF